MELDREKTKQILYVRNVKIESENFNFKTFLSFTSQSSSKQKWNTKKFSTLIQMLSFDKKQFLPHSPEAYIVKWVKFNISYSGVKGKSL